MVSIQKISKKQQFAKHLLGLNKSFYSWLREQIAQDSAADLSAGFQVFLQFAIFFSFEIFLRKDLSSQDYIDHSSSLEDLYLRTYGEVLTFGSGDCGQLAHGSEDIADLEVKYPRVVYSLRDKKVMGIACGGIHNAIYTSSGQVYTWGCADDGALGRIGDENMPMLVDVSSSWIILL